MAYQATHRFARISARKVRPLADLIRGKHADTALAILKAMPHRGAAMLRRVLQSALGNAEHARAPQINQMIVVDARVDGGPMFKRIRPRARGMAYMILKRFSHIHVAVDAPAKAAAQRGGRKAAAPEAKGKSGPAASKASAG